jgi:hypothetical protein
MKPLPEVETKFTTTASKKGKEKKSRKALVSLNTQTK